MQPKWNNGVGARNQPSQSVGVDRCDGIVHELRSGEGDDE